MRQPWYVTNHSDLYAVFFPTFVTVLHLTLECAPGSGANLLKSMDWRTYSPAY